jgi:thioesterase domain-containing protein/acyl carrier protein
VEVQLIHIWEELLGVELIGPTQSFFDLGGNSLLALRLAAQIKRRLSCDLPLASLFAGATVRQMAAAILEQQASAAAPRPAVVPLQPAGTLPPLFCVHPAGREVHGYINLVRHLGGDQPVYGVPDLGEDLARPLAQIAAEHVQAVRAVQPEGPYHLLGWSFGGSVVYEMAVQLERDGQQVAFVGLLDSMETVMASEVLEFDDADLVLGLAGDLAAQMGRPFSLRRDELDGLELEEQFRRAAEELDAQGVAALDFCSEWLRESYDVVEARGRSRKGYAPGRFSGWLTLFRPGEAREEFEAHTAAWSACCTEEEQRTLCWSRLTPDRVDVSWVPGTHATMGREPHVRGLAERMREALATARERAAAAAPAEPGLRVTEIFA